MGPPDKQLSTHSLPFFENAKTSLMLSLILIDSRLVSRHIHGLWRIITHIKYSYILFISYAHTHRQYFLDLNIRLPEEKETVSTGFKRNARLALGKSQRMRKQLVSLSFYVLYTGYITIFLSLSPHLSPSLPLSLSPLTPKILSPPILTPPS